MDINRAGFGALAVAGIVAAGGGAYLANRHNDAAVVESAPAYAIPTDVAVTETENQIAAPLVAVEAKPAAATGTRSASACAARERTPHDRGHAPHPGTPARSHAELRR